MTDPRDNHSVISSLLNSVLSSPKLKKAAGVFVAAFIGAIAVNGFTGNGITNALKHAVGKPYISRLFRFYPCPLRLCPGLGFKLILFDLDRRLKPYLVFTRKHSGSQYGLCLFHIVF